MQQQTSIFLKSTQETCIHRFTQIKREYHKSSTAMAWTNKISDHHFSLVIQLIQSQKWINIQEMRSMTSDLRGEDRIKVKIGILLRLKVLKICHPWFWVRNCRNHYPIKLRIERGGMWLDKGLMIQFLMLIIGTKTL